MTAEAPEPPSMSRRERRIGRRLEARGQRRLFDCLLRLRGTTMRERFALHDLYAVGGQGAVYRVIDDSDPDARLVAKLALVRWDKPVQLTSKSLRKARAVIEAEARLLTTAGSPYLPHCEALQQFENPLLETARGGEFAKPEPCLVMERLPGQDLDVWLCRVHRGGVDTKALRRTFDRLVVGVLQALADLERRGYLYVDLRPGNLRVLGRPDRRVRLLDAGGCVRIDAEEPNFPHVPSYLPPRLFSAGRKGQVLRPSAATMASMAGRTLYEVATGEAPKASRHLDMMRLLRSPVSAPVAEVIAGLAAENYENCEAALDTLAARARKRVARPNGAVE
jgi:serine/threonine protein kinase